jgi:hypothetical protein
MTSIIGKRSYLKVLRIYLNPGMATENKKLLKRERFQSWNLN